MKFQFVSQWSQLYSYLVGLLSFLTTIKLIKLLRFNSKISFLSKTLRKVGKDLALFSCMFGIVFISFVQFFHIILLRDMFQFSTFILSVETSFAMMLGKFDFRGMTSSNPLSPFFFLLFMIVNVFILLNMFLSIINESFSSIKADAAREGNEHEIVDYIIGRFKAWTGECRMTWPDCVELSTLSRMTNPNISAHKC